jgi:hypothetical protein
MDSWLEADGGASKRVRGAAEGILAEAAAAGLKSEEKSMEGAMAAGLPLRQRVILVRYG